MLDKGDLQPWLRLFLWAVICAVSCGRLSGVEIEAYYAEPFGVAKVSMRTSPAGDELVPGKFLQSDGRALYPSYSRGRFLDLVGKVLGEDRVSGIPREVTVRFLFRGSSPMRITLYVPEPINLEIIPKPGAPRQVNRLVRDWWKDYQDNLAQFKKGGDHPKTVETFLTTMLSRRMGLAEEAKSEGANSLDWQTVGLMAQADSEANRALKEVVRGESPVEADREISSLPLIPWDSPPIPELPEVSVEPLATRVPEECFYIRFGSFANQLWLEKLTDEFGGELANMIAVPGFQRSLGKKVRKQIGLELDALAELFGGALVGDVCMLGRDMYLADGASIGVMMEARNSTLLGFNLNTKRAALASEFADAGATLETVQIGGRDVSFLSTPDNRMRSFYVADGAFHLVTTSRAIVERFLETGAGERPLASNAAFRLARSKRPLEREDTIFCFFSPTFFQELLSPQYQIELKRRLRATAEIQTLELARFAAGAERRDAKTAEQLVASDFLPRGFGERPDGSGLIELERGAVDSLRGARGSFLPIADVPIDLIADKERSDYLSLSSYVASRWKKLDPIMFAIKRYDHDTEPWETLEVEAQMAPFDNEKFRWITGVIGPPTKTLVGRATNDIIHVQAHLQGGTVDPRVGPHHVFIGIQNEPAPPIKVGGGITDWLQVARTAPGYAGAWPRTGLFDRLPFNLIAGKTDPFGYSQLPFGLWRRVGDGFAVLAFNRRRLEQVTPELFAYEDAAPYQARWNVGDLSKSYLAPWIGSLQSELTLKSSRGNAVLLDLLTQQLGVEESQAKDEAELLFGGKIVCPSGGEYQLQPIPSGLNRWVSTSWPEVGGPERSQNGSPILKWFRGARGGVLLEDNALVVKCEIDLERGAITPRTPDMTLPTKPEEEAAPEELPQAKPIPLFPEPMPAPKSANGNREF